jgi:pimeloyl-ACP methyl ester carboxylesterase
MEMHETTVRGIPMRWREAGEGTPVVLVHGIPTSSALWRHVVPLVHGARCLAFEMVGYGDSIPQGLDRDISVAQQASYLLAWLDELGIDRAAYVGHDLGGGVVQIAAVQEPERCAGLVITNGIAYDSWPIPSVSAMQKLGPALHRIPDMMIKPFLATFYRRGHDDAEKAKEALAVYWPAYARHGAAAALGRQVRSLRTRDTLDIARRLPELDVPARIVWGAADQFQKIEYGERLSWDLDAPITRIAEGKHWTPEDHPAEIAAALHDVLAQVG